MFRRLSLFKTFKLHRYFFAVLGLIIFGAVSFMSQATIAKQMDEWQLLPRPQRFSELYFTDKLLPTVLKRGANQKLAFTLHNLEHQPTSYHYEVVAVSDDNRPEQLLGKGNVWLVHNQFKVIVQSIIVPTLGTRVGIRVNLTYEGIKLSANKAAPEKQSIQLWAKLAGKVATHAGN